MDSPSDLIADLLDDRHHIVPHAGRATADAILAALAAEGIVLCRDEPQLVGGTWMQYYVPIVQEGHTT